jgi:hypothetical protein
MKMQDELELRSRLLSGRQALLMMAQSFKTADDTETYLGIAHVANLPMLNNDLDNFWLKWEQIVAQLPPNAIQPKGLETMLYGKVRKHPELQVSIREYERASATSIIKTYEWLSTEVHRCCHTERMHKNFDERDNRMRAMGGGKTLKVAAVKEEDPGESGIRPRSDQRDFMNPLLFWQQKGKKEARATKVTQKTTRGDAKKHQRVAKVIREKENGRIRSKRSIYPPLLLVSPLDVSKTQRSLPLQTR